MSEKTANTSAMGIEPPPDSAGVHPIWPGTAPGSEAATWHEQIMQRPAAESPTRMVTNVSTPTVTVFKPAPAVANGKVIIVAPGGAFHFLMIDFEGYDVARWLTGLGYTAFVLKYRLHQTPENEADLPAFRENLHKSRPGPGRDEINPPSSQGTRHQARLWAEEDGRQSIRFVRSRAADWGIDPASVGIMGFSAGGGVAVNAVLEHDAESRPDFAGAVYPAYRLGPPVPEGAPPLFIVTSDGDQQVAPMSSSRLYEAWHKAGSPVELHVFAHGVHGFGMKRLGDPSDVWTELFKSWLERHA